MLDREQAAGAREARLDLVRDEHDAVPAAKRAEPPQQLRRSHVKTALALYWLDDDRRNLRGLDVGVEQRVERSQALPDTHASMFDRERNSEHILNAARQTALVGHELAG